VGSNPTPSAKYQKDLVHAGFTGNSYQWRKPGANRVPGICQLKALASGLFFSDMAVSVSSRYRMIRQLGRGGMGEVLLAEDTELERRVALKVMSAELAGDGNERKRFRTEARLASALTHPNICVIHEVGETEDGRPFLAMEYVEGETLGVLEQQRRLKLSEVVTIGIEVAEALQAAHEFHLVHRDIKPSNMMLDSRGHVKVLDFGLAKRVAQEELSPVGGTSEAHTRTGSLVGTPYYMSPEQVLGRELDHRTDLFSLGVVLYEMVVGQRPFLGSTIGEVINNVVNQQPEPLGLENSRYSPALDRIIFKCLEKDPEQRYASARALARDLTILKNQSDRVTAPGKEEYSQVLDAPKTLAGSAPALVVAPTPRRLLNRKAAFVGTALALLLLAAGLALWIRHPRSQGPALASGSSEAPPQKSVAVLPFDNFSPERDTDYLSDGLTEEITTALSKVPGLKVVSRNSSFMFKGKREDLRQVGRTLHVATVLEGSLRKVGSQIRVSAQLINAADGFHLWSESYDRSMDDIIAVQEDIARRIAERLQGKSAPIKLPAVSPEAHKLYLQGRLFWNKRTEAGLKKAIELYQQALEKDATYAEAQAALASSYLLLPQYSFGLRFSPYGALARAAANRGLALDPNCAEAHAVLGMLLKHEQDIKGADEHLRRAVESEPNNATAHHWYGLCLEFSGRREEGLAELQKALELDPLSPIIHSTIPEWYYIGRDYDRAIAEARKVIDTFPDFPAARIELILPLIQKGQFREALAEIEGLRALTPDTPLAALHFRGFCLARLGQEAEARKLLAQLDEQRQQGKATEGLMAMIYQGLRDYDKLFELAEQMRQTEGIDPEILVDPALDELRSLPEFQALLQRAGLTNAPVVPAP
jgi:eukaryotic-like serine/threonine-protein kinase